MLPRILVANVGPLVQAEVDVAPLTLLMGENNTGKTVFATIVHQVVATVSSLQGPMSRHERDNFAPELAAMIREQFSEGRPTLFDGSAWVPSPQTLEWAQQYLHTTLERYAGDLRQNLEYAFGVEARELHRRTSSGRRSTSPSFVEVVNRRPSWRVRVNFHTEDIEVHPPDAKEWLLSVIVGQTAEEISASARQLFESTFGLFVPPPAIFKGWPRQSVHLPAGRTGILQSYQILASSVVRQSAAAGIRPIEVPTLPGTAADFLSLLLALPGRVNARHRRSQKSPYTSSVQGLEEEIQVRIDFRLGANGVNEVIAVTPQGEFALARTSSMVSELAPILLVLKQALGRDDQIVVDEPEAHLHPAMQRILARFFARLVQQGVALVLTTHSDYLIGELNNLIRRGLLNDLTSHPALWDEEEASNPVAALRFERKVRGCYAKRLEVTAEDGIDETTFTDVMSALYDDAVAALDVR